MLDRTTPTTAAWLVALCMVSAATWGGEEAVAGRAVEAEVRAAVEQSWKRHIEAARQKDLERVMEIYADDVIYVTPDLESVRGIDAVRAMEAQTLASSTVLHAEHVVRGLHVADGVAYEIGTVSGKIRPGEAEPVTVDYHFMAQWRRTGPGRWQLGYLVGQPELSEGE